MKLTARKVKFFARKQGVDLVGIAPMERFKSVPPVMHPASIFPEARSVAVLARQIPRGALRGIEEGTFWGKMGTDRALDIRITYELCRFLEDSGWEAVPVYPLAPERWPEGVSVYPDRPAPNVTPSFEYAAVAAGLGEIGYCKVFLTPQFGPRQQLGMIITDAQLEPDPLFEGDVCDRCMECVKSCPLNAISEGDVDEIMVAGKKMTYGKINFKACRVCPNGAFPNVSAPKTGEPERLAASCVRACYAHLEATGRLQSKFYNPFRKRKPWCLGIFDV